MGDLVVYKFNISSHKGIYSVTFDNELLSTSIIDELGSHYIVDKRVYEIVTLTNKFFLKNKQVTLIDANEYSKSYVGIQPIIQDLIDKKLKRDSRLVAIGGGITQDITCFIANNYMRGIDWHFIPTTLLAQADSCIGSKSSINFGDIKNLLGSYHPPRSIFISNEFLKTLDNKDIKSGIGEIIKLFLIAHKRIDSNLIKLDDLTYYINQALLIKKDFIEKDEFDKGVRNLLNYGHCLGHAFESASNYYIPHGIAITMGMDVVNLLSYNLGLIDKDFFDHLQSSIGKIYNGYQNTPMSASRIFEALLNDKKNTDKKINLIIPSEDNFQKRGFEFTAEFQNEILSVFNMLDFNVQS